MKSFEEVSFNILVCLNQQRKFNKSETFIFYPEECEERVEKINDYLNRLEREQIIKLLAVPKRFTTKEKPFLKGYHDDYKVKILDGFNYYFEKAKQNDLEIGALRFKLLSARKKGQEKKFRDRQDYWFEGKTFKLMTAGNNLKVINFSPTKQRGANPYCLFYSIIELLNTKGKLEDNGWFCAEISQGDILKSVKENFDCIKDKEWLKNTKSNLRKVIPQDISPYIQFSPYNRLGKYYHFGLKLPPR